MNRRYSYQSVHSRDRAEWQIVDRELGSHFDPKAIIWRCPYLREHDCLAEPPKEVRVEYERLLAEAGQLPKPGIPENPFVNVVEMIQSDDADCAWDQPCAHGHRVEFHAVYCHNEQWLYSPRKCHRSQKDPEWRHQDCPGFLANPLWKPTGG
jgi:hypothetical protein